MTKQADVVVIGGGITGTAILHELAKYNLRAVLVEQEPETGCRHDKGQQCHPSRRFRCAYGQYESPHERRRQCDVS